MLSVVTDGIPTSAKGDPTETWLDCCSVAAGSFRDPETDEECPLRHLLLLIFCLVRPGSYASVREKGSYCKIYVEFIEVLLIGQNM